MLVDVSLSGEAIAEVSHSHAGFNATTLQRTLQEFLIRHGNIRQPSETEAEKLVASVKNKKLTPDERKKWTTLLLKLRKTGRLGTTTPSLLESWGTTTHADLKNLHLTNDLVAIISEELYRKLFTQPNGRQRVERTEFVTPGTVAISSRVDQVERLYRGGIFPAATHRDDVWRELLEPLTRVSSTITLFDRYLYNRLWNESAKLRPRPEHIEWILQKINESATKSIEVNLIGAEVDGRSHNYSAPQSEKLLDLVQTSFQDRFHRISNISVYVCQRRQDMHHDRHIRFSTGHALEFPSGLDRFARPKIEDSMSFAYRYSADALRELEQRETDALTASRHPDTRQFH